MSPILVKFHKNRCALRKYVDRKAWNMWWHSGQLTEWVTLFPFGWWLGGKCTHRVSTFIWPFPKVFLLFCKHCWKGLQYSLGMVSNCFLGASPIVSQRRLWHFLDISIEATCFCLYWLKLKTQHKNFRPICCSSPNYYPSSHTTSSQTQIVRQPL
jgi:hypothetical protein